MFEKLNNPVVKTVGKVYGVAVIASMPGAVITGKKEGRGWSLIALDAFTCRLADPLISVVRKERARRTALESRISALEAQLNPKPAAPAVDAPVASDAPKTEIEVPKPVNTLPMVAVHS